MFTGLIEEIGTILNVQKSNAQMEFECESKLLSSHLSKGDSVAINGACQTVTEIKQQRSFVFKSIRDTLESTNLGGLRRGSRVNLERALSLQGRLDGHLMQGHVDETATVVRTDYAQPPFSLKIRLSGKFADLIVRKGSIAIDGVSLTIQEIYQEEVRVGLIEHTLSFTNLKNLRPADLVNIEYDLIGKYIQRKINLFREENQHNPNNYLLNKLRENGFV